MVDRVEQGEREMEDEGGPPPPEPTPSPERTPSPPEKPSEPQQPTHLAMGIAVPFPEARRPPCVARDRV